MQKWYRGNKFLLGFFCALSSVLFSQTKTDNDLIFEKTTFVSSFETKREVTYLFAGKNAFIKYNPVSLVFGGLMYVYQKTISVQIGAACPYEVNCSNFSKQCIQKYGVLKGIPLTADRLTRCTKLAGIDMIEGVDFNSRTHKIYDHPNDYKAKNK
ncbi:MAG: membrane protein insertion efficiency factor YidD [Bacteroidota bacterium]|nr:membrane protein insertion efficiency factor YidD [Bacteroidota bacterium]